MDSLKVMLMPLLIIFGACALILIISAMRNKVIFKMGARNLPRRFANTTLTCLGLMLAAMIFSASFATGDTLTHSIRNIAIEYLGEVDIMVMKEGVEFGAFQGHQMESVDRTNYFDESEFETIRDSLSDLIGNGIVEGVAPAIIETVPAVAPSRLNEPVVNLLSFDSEYMAGFDTLLDEHGNELSLEKLESLGEGYIYINTKLAESLETGVNDKIELFLGMQGTNFIVAGIYESGGNPSTFSFDSGATAVIAINQMKALRGSDDINYILITNRGGSIEGATQTDAVTEVLEPLLEETEFKFEPVKQEALDNADEGGTGFSTIFLVFGSFSMIAGILLIFLIFVMLAAERKQELGIARAIGTQRGHIIRLFTFEGVLYALIASAVGSLLGLLVSWGGIQVMDAAFKEMGFHVIFDFTSTGLIISYLMGVLFTLLVVYVSAWRVSNLNIICAIKDIPEPPNTEKESIWNHFKRAYLVFPLSVERLLEVTGLRFKLFVRLIPVIFPIIGGMQIAIGIQQTQWATYSLGFSLAIIGVFMLARKWPLRLPDRPAYTLAGIGLLIFWLSPVEWHPRGEEMGAGFEMFILTGVFLVAGGVWVIMYNSDLLLAAIMAIFGRLQGLTPMIKTAVSYPMASRFRTGMAVAMFSLIIFTLVYMSCWQASFKSVLDDTDRVAGGFHIRAETNYLNPIVDIETAITEADDVSMDDFIAIGSFNIFQANMRDGSESTKEDADVATSNEPITDDGAIEDSEWAELWLMGANVGYTENVNYDFEIINANYNSKEEVWQALAEDPSLAVVSTAMVPSKITQMGDSGIDLIIGEGEFVYEDDFIPDSIFVEVQNPFSKEVQKLQIIGVLDVMAGPYAGMVTTSQATLNNYAGFDVSPLAYRLQVIPEKMEDIPLLAKNLEKAFMENGMNAEVMSEEVEAYGRINDMFMNLIMAFMALGLIVGVAALGVIAARSVVERRQQIGMLRAIGFQQGMIQFSFLLESSFVALLGMFLGVALGAATAFLFMSDSGIEGIKTIIPWGRIGVIVGVTYIVSLLTTFLPAYQAARIYPAEALRYE